MSLNIASLFCIKMSLVLCVRQICANNLSSHLEMLTAYIPRSFVVSLFARHVRLAQGFS